ncbi:hypothetical protein NliqN6_2075 [Naganishia liquefaciens]|uniref:Transmembrane protein n=1 Tax=Naganishia liquefaciens TaxID=104408 RepID=A0A8H3YDX7_9TREE|nr:hypothetical protein NliqN6_2075 [Naganishia liquefaciens]
MQPQPQPQPGLSAIQPHASGRPPPVVAVVVVVVDRWDKADHAEEATRCDTEEGDRPYAAQRYAVVRNHVQWITAVLLALCTFTVIEISRDLLLSSRTDLEYLLANYDLMSPLGDATRSLSWLCVATSLWLLFTQLEGTLCALVNDGDGDGDGNGAACLFNTVALDGLIASSAAGGWLYIVVQHGQRMKAFWRARTIEPRCEWMVGCAAYLAVAITGMLFLHAAWTCQAAVMVVVRGRASVGDVAFHNVNELLADFGPAVRLTDGGEEIEEEANFTARREKSGAS